MGLSLGQMDAVQLKNLVNTSTILTFSTMSMESTGLKQLSTSVSNETYDEVVSISKREFRTLSATVAMLLDKAIKERNRKKKRATEKDYS